MKNILFVITIIVSLSLDAFAEASDKKKDKVLNSTESSAVGNFFLKPFLSIEYNAPEVSGGGSNTDFKVSEGVFHQIRDFENIALGINLRIHKYLGFNANWVQSDLESASLKDIGSLSKKARFRVDQYNLSMLFYIPLNKDLFEIFIEGGVSDVNSKINYTRSNGDFVERRAHETVGLYGVGFQVIPDKNSAIRFSYQRYSGKLALLDSNYSTIRIGYLKSF